MLRWARVGRVASVRPALLAGSLLLASIVAGPTLAAQSPVIFSPDISANLGTSGSQLVDDDDAANDNAVGTVTIPPYLATMFGAIPASAEVAGFELSSSGGVGHLIAVDTTVALPGLPAGSPAEARDVVRFDPNTTTFSMFFDGSANSIPEGVAIDALASAGNELLLSFDTTVTLPGAGTVDDEDLVSFSAGSYAMYFDGSANGVPVELDLDAAQLAGGKLLVSFDGSGSLGGVAFDDEDVVELDLVGGGGYAMHFDGSTSDPTDWPPADLVGLPEPGVGASLLAGALALGAVKRKRQHRNGG